MPAGKNEIKLRWNANRTGCLEHRPYNRKIADSAINRSTSELDGSNSEHTAARIGSMFHFNLVNAAVEYANLQSVKNARICRAL